MFAQERATAMFTRVDFTFGLNLKRLLKSA